MPTVFAVYAKPRRGRVNGRATQISPRMANFQAQATSMDGVAGALEVIANDTTTTSTSLGGTLPGCGPASESTATENDSTTSLLGMVYEVAASSMTLCSGPAAVLQDTGNETTTSLGMVSEVAASSMPLCSGLVAVRLDTENDTTSMLGMVSEVADSTLPVCAGPVAIRQDTEMETTTSLQSLEGRPVLPKSKRRTLPILPIVTGPLWSARWLPMGYEGNAAATGNTPSWKRPNLVLWALLPDWPPRWLPLCLRIPISSSKRLLYQCQGKPLQARLHLLVLSPLALALVVCAPLLCLT